MGDLNSILGLLASNTQLAGSEAGQNLPAARTGLKTSQDYWSKILTGSKDDLLSLFAPDVHSVTDQYDSARKNAMELSPRGGGRTAAQGEARVAEGKAVNDLLFKGRQTAADKVSDVSGQIGSLGLGELGAGTSAAGASASANLSKSSNTAAILGSLGAGIGSLITGLILKKTNTNPVITNFSGASDDLGDLLDGLFG